MIMKRDKAEDQVKKMTYPQSPSFVNYAVINPNDPPGKEASTHKLHAKKEAMMGVVDFCRSKNIPFIDEEERYYKVNRFK